MNKESLYELQKIDCNCNDCGYMKRDLSRLPDRGKPSPINYGQCIKFDKEVSFIPATCQIETQECFVHRKDFIAV
jgi:hypothetical protein